MKDMTTYLQERFPLAISIARTGKCSYIITYAWLNDESLVFYALCDNEGIIEIQQA